MNNFVETHMKKINTVIVSEIRKIMPYRRASITNCTLNTSSNQYIPTIIHQAY